MVGADRFVEVFVDTPLEVCEQRDTKGIYAQARRGEIKNFTGIDDPYEIPLQSEITLDTVSQSAEENALCFFFFFVGCVFPPPPPFFLFRGQNTFMFRCSGGLLP